MTIEEAYCNFIDTIKSALDNTHLAGTSDTTGLLGA